MQKKQILIDGKILSYYENSLWKKQWVLLFLHGWMQDGKSFEKIFQILEKKNIPYISIDLPGFWGSQLIHDNMTIDEYTNVTKGFIEKMWLAKPVILWHSFWGRICINLWSYYTNLSKIVLLCAAGVQRKIPTHKYLVIKTAKVILSLPGLRVIWAKVREGFSSPDLKNAGKMTKIFRNTIAQDLQDKMKRVSYPTLMIWWKSDDQTPVWDAQIIHNHMKNSQLYILEGTHFVHQEKADEITTMILDFIKK